MELFSDFTTAVVAGLTILALLCISWRKKISSSSGGRLPPEAAGAWPFVGHLHQLQAAPVPLVRTWGALADKYGPIFTVRLGTPRAVVVSSWEAVRDCFATNDKLLAGRPDLCAGKYLAYNCAVFTWATYGPYWRKLRKLAVVELLSNTRLEQLKHIWISELQSNITQLYTSLNITSGNPNNLNSPGTKVDMSRWFGQLTLNMIVKIVAGRRYEYRGDNEEEDEEGRALKQIFKDNMYLAGQIVLGDALSPFWLFRWLDVEGHIKSMKRVARAMDAIFQDWVDEHNEKRKQSSLGDEARDIIDVMLSVIDDKFMDGLSFTRDTIIKATIRTMLLDGVDTIAVHLTWVLSEMLNNRHVMKLVQEEVETKVGIERLVEDSDIENLVYLQAVVKETLRLHPPLPFLVPHEAMEDCSVCGYHIPKGTQLYVNAWKLHRDPEIWSEPDKFMPERFLAMSMSEATDVVANRQFQLIPFGYGRRSCPGMLYAMRVTYLTLARLLQVFNFSTLSNAPLDMTEGLGITLARANPLELLVTPRLLSLLEIRDVNKANQIEQ